MADLEEPDAMREAWPTTVSEAVDRLMTGLSPLDLERLRARRKKDLILEHFGLALWIRNSFGLWQGNEALLESCADFVHEDRTWYLTIDSDTASGIIVRALHESLVAAGGAPVAGEPSGRDPVVPGEMPFGPAVPNEDTQSTGGTTMKDQDAPVGEDDVDGEVFNIDADIENADWLRSLYWDLPLEPEKVFVIICGTYGTVEDQKANWEHFLTLPAARPMPPEVRAGIEHYLASGGASALPRPDVPPAAR